MHSSAKAPERDLGVLFVHGIGDQAQASTLVEWGTPIFEWLQGRASADSVGGRVEVSRASLTPPDDEPAHTEIRIERHGLDRTWLLAEAWWAEAFAAPQFRDLARWSFSVVPWTFGTHFGRRLWRAWRTPARGVGAGLLWLARVSGAFAALMGGIVLSLLMLLVLSVLLAVGVIPWQRLRESILRIQLRMASVVGDSYILVGRPIEAAAILTRFRRELDWLSARCRRVAVVAHSQGGAVATLGLAGTNAGAVRRLITFGSGLRKLEELVELRQSNTFVRGAALTLVGLVLTAFVGVSLPQVLPEVVAGTRSLAEMWWMGAYLLTGLPLLVGGIRDFVSSSEPQRIRELIQLLSDQEIEWTDLYASADPVPNGQLHDHAELPPRSIQVINRGSMLSDHTGYWGNRDEFVTLVVDALLGCDARPILPRLAREEIAVLRRRRSRRVRMLQTIGWVGVASIAALLVQYRAEWASVLAWIATALGDRVAAFFGGGLAVAVLPPADVWGRSVGWLSLILLARVAGGWLWSLWDRLESEKPPPYRYVGSMNTVVTVALMFQLLMVAFALSAGDPPGWLFFLVLVAGLVPGILFAGGSTASRTVQRSAEPALEPVTDAGTSTASDLAERPERASPEPTPRSRAVRVWNVIARLFWLGILLVAGPLGMLQLVRWTRELLARLLDVPDASWIWAVLVILVGLVLASLLLLLVARLALRARAPSEADPAGVIHTSATSGSTNS